MALRRKCVLTDKLKAEYPFLEKRPKFSDSDISCKICNSNFSIANSGKSQIEKHLKSDSHQKCLLSVASSKKVPTFFPKLNPSDADLDLAVKEGTFAYHTVKHDQSFRSMDCTGKLIRQMFNQRFSAARTKCEAIVTSVLSPRAHQDLIQDINSSSCVALSTDCSNHMEVKMFPVVIRYFSASLGIQVKLLDIHQLKNETAETLCETLYSSITINNLSSKVVCLCADNTNTNFGGVNRRGQNNFFTKLNDKLPQSIVGIGCAAHILNNAFEHAINNLPFDIEALIYKIYKHFSIYTVRTESLKGYCEFVNVEYRKVLSSCKTRWLSLSPALGRTISIYDALKAYFLSEPNVPKIIMEFFEKEENEIWLWFAHLQAETFNRSVLEVEGDNPSAVEVLNCIKNLEAILETRKLGKFVGLKGRELLTRYGEDGLEVDSIYKTVDRFYSTAIEYLKKWKEPFNKLKKFSWILLNKPVLWSSVENSTLFVKTHFPLVVIDDGKLIDELALVNANISADDINDWNERRLHSDQRWIIVFSRLRILQLRFENLQRLVEVGFTIPGTSAPVERVFYVINNYWTAEKTQLHLDTLIAVIRLKMNVSKTCTEYSEWLKTEPKLLRAIHSSQKYA